MSENSGNVGAQGKNNSSQQQNISGELTQAINQLPQSQQADLSGIEELLTQLKTAIAASDQLQPEQKTASLEQVKVLAETGKNPQTQENRTAAKTAIATLGGMINQIAGVPTVVGTWERIQPEISEIFGLE